MLNKRHHHWGSNMAAKFAKFFKLTNIYGFILESLIFKKIIKFRKMSREGQNDNCATCGNRISTVTGCSSCSQIGCLKCIGQRHEKRFTHPKFQEFLRTCSIQYDKGLINIFLSICKCGARYVCNCNGMDCNSYRIKFKLKNVKSNKKRCNYRFRHPVEWYPELNKQLQHIQKKFNEFTNKSCDNDMFFFDKGFKEKIMENKNQPLVIDSDDEDDIIAKRRTNSMNLVEAENQYQEATPMTQVILSSSIQQQQLNESSSNTKFSIQNDAFKQQLNKSSSIQNVSNIQNDIYKDLYLDLKVKVEKLEKKIQDQDELHKKEILALIEKSEKKKDELIKQIIDLTESKARLSTTIEMLGAINPIRKPIKRNFSQCNEEAGKKH
ncbi:hypothetical protein RFI_02745 [Reticulomyxa filosa]|uniref:Uncharacterized protein n=1 Tax=Reticulomyxa filosa TaxID=46433 RepID=X6P8F7_RETFI|nr:hypothetical protein RFI_02745 [Reticulomyxa filosa]|eukprot:ETO34349.1 hypothetical protein RFI_02745 [Reticulomyxa filosa]